ncbi:MAG: ORF6N domain-containing protein [Chthoniobacteraceae bacterium]
MPKALPIETAETLVRMIRGHRVMLDSDLAGFYGVETKRLLEQVRRNIHRFPDDFAFRLEPQELANLRSQIATSSLHGGRRTMPWVFTEHGAVMLASVLNSAVAIAASVEIVRAFVKMRNALSASDLVAKLTDIEKRITGHNKDISALFGALRQLLETPSKDRGEIGFHTLREDEPGTSRSDFAKTPHRKVRYTDLVPKRTRKKKTS